MSRRIAPIIALLLAFVLTGCRLEVVTDVVMANDGSGKVTVTAMADAELINSQPDLITDLDFTDAIENGWEVDDPVVAADGSATLVMRHAFADKAELANVLRSIGPPLLAPGAARTSDSRQVTNAITANLQLPNGYGSFADSDLVSAAGGVPFQAELDASGVPAAQGFGFTININLPGKLISAPNGTAVGEDGTISWVAPTDGTALGLEIRTVQQIGTGSNWWAKPLSWVSLALLVAWVVFAVGFIVFVAYSRRKRRANRQNAMRNLSDTRSSSTRRRRRGQR